MLSSGYDGALALWNCETGEVRLLGYHRHLINRVVTDDAGRRAATCSSDHTIGLWNLDEMRLDKSLVGHSDDVEDFVFIDAASGVSASRDHRIIVWDLKTGAIRFVLEGHQKDVLALAHANGRLYSSGDDKTLRVWDLQTGLEVQCWGPFDHETDSCAIDAVRCWAVTMASCVSLTHVGLRTCGR